MPQGVLEDALAGLTPVEITGTGVLLTQLAGRVIEAPLGAKLTEHLGYPPGAKPPGGGMSARDISDHLTRLYGTPISRDSISRITGSVLEDIAAWRNRPLDRIYPIVYFDAMIVKVREDRYVQNRACYPAIGVTVDGKREALGIWWQDNEGATFWLGVLNDLEQRGVEDVLIACVDGLQGFPEAINAVFEGAWAQTCIVHQVRNGLKCVGYQDRKKVAAALRRICTAINEDDALDQLEAFDNEWRDRFPMITDAQR